MLSRIFLASKQIVETIERKSQYQKNKERNLRFIENNPQQPKIFGPSFVGPQRRRMSRERERDSREGERGESESERREKKKKQKTKNSRGRGESKRREKKEKKKKRRE